MQVRRVLRQCREIPLEAMRRAARRSCRLPRQRGRSCWGPIGSAHPDCLGSLSLSAGSYPHANACSVRAQGAVIVRTHIILLGGGADVSCVSYGADYLGEWVRHVLRFVECTRIVWCEQHQPETDVSCVSDAAQRDGTNTPGPVQGARSGVCAYSFWLLDNGSVITTLTHGNGVWSAGLRSVFSACDDLRCRNTWPSR